MKLTLDFIISEFEYTEPIIVRSHVIKNNQLLSIKVTNHDEFIAQLDLSALPYFHQYSAIEWKYTLLHIFSQQDISLKEISLEMPFFNMLKNIPDVYAHGEFLFIIESILFLVVEKYSPQSLNNYSKESIRSNALMGENFNFDSNPACIKLKIRPTLENLSKTKLAMKTLLTNNPDTKIRLDGNRSFELLDLIQFMHECERFFETRFLNFIEYIEEPLKNSLENNIFSNQTKYTLALDESLEMMTDLNRVNLDVISAIVIKPALLGISKSNQLMKEAMSLGINAVISSSYETKSAIRPLLYLAHINPHTFHGFDTLKYLPKDLSIESANLSLKF